jgi:hypothetical protein
MNKGATSQRAQQSKVRHERKRHALAKQHNYQHAKQLEAQNTNRRAQSGLYKQMPK